MSVRIVLLSVLFLCPLIALGQDVEKKETPKLGSVLNLNSMAQCALNRTALLYNNYGCFCGMGGSGRPIDEIDACCRRHDLCYGMALDSGDCGNLLMEYIDPYDWSCVNHTPVCTHTPSQSKCQQALCWCDRMVVECWSLYPLPGQKLGCNRTPKSKKSDRRRH
uniref:Phospholipase A2 n=1 Tax=Steinernema glaseri TaxID=37863 RepID=A0A1I7YNK4_9BILA